MQWDKVLYPTNEQPLDRLIDGYSHTAVFRRIAFIGDSLSSGEFETVDDNGAHGYHDLYEYSWGQYIARKHGLTAFNFSRGGMTAKEFVNSFAAECGFWDTDKACQAYVIALGVNDLLNLRMPLGSVDDIGTDRETFARYYAEIVTRYKAIQPDAVFFFVTIPQSDDPVVQEQATALATLLHGFAQRFERCFVIDLFRYAPVYDARFREQFYLHGHMSPSGYIFTAQIIDSYIDWLVRHHPDTFRTIGFVGSGIAYT